VRLIGVLMGSLRMLPCRLAMFFTLGVVAFAVMFGCGSMRLSCILVVLGGFVVLVSCHY
jgi:hypothetical protein